MAIRVNWEGEGEHCTKKDGCMNCDIKPAKGVYFKRAADQRHMFICDHCGYKDCQGWGTESHQIMVQKKEEYQHAFDNRDRWRRENTEKFNQDWERATENMEMPPDGVKNFYDTMRGPNIDLSKEAEDNDE